MSRITNPFDIYKMLPQTNCGECTLPTCLAFAAAVIKGQKKPAACPYLEPEILEKLSSGIGIREDFDRIRGEDLATLKSRLQDIDLARKAEMLGARMAGEKLVIRSLGKEFFVDPRGTVSSECHTHAWMTMPLLSYIVHSSGSDISNRWVPFRELKDGGPMNPLFVQRSELPLKKLIDTHPELLGDLLSMFSGKRADNQLFDSDLALSLYPLPKVPILFCYWNAESDMDSNLNIFFDVSAEEHLKIESIFSLGVGMAMMFEKIAQKHY